MTFLEFYNTKSSDINFATDKGGIHDYIDGYYSDVFTPFKDKETNLLEIGIYRGQSLRLFREWFTKGRIVGIDIGEYVDVNTFKIDNVDIFWGGAYDSNMLDLFKDNYFDFIVDDGPHTLESQIYSIMHWTKKLKSGGKLIIEDIQSINHIEVFERVTDTNLYTFRSFDLRANKNRYDDIVFEITKK
jgi:hypothetical protein